MIWDGECHFCRLWIERWRVLTAGEIEYETYQKTAVRFPEIPQEQFQRSVVYIDKAGDVFFAAEAVYRSLSCRSSRKWMAWSYDHIPGFAAISEIAYKIIARHRTFGSAVTQLLWGADVRPPTYFAAHRWFLRALGLVYLIAFVSFWVQVNGLVGANGILPVRQFLSAAYEQLGGRAYSILPTLCWFNSSNAFLHFLCGGGVVLSLLLICGIVPVACLIALFVFYLSLTIAGQTFLNFQWDILLLEAGFLSIFLAPWQWWPKRDREPPPSRARLSLLVATAADNFRVVGRQKPGMVQTFFGRLLSRGRNHCAASYLGAAPAAAHRRRFVHFSASCHRAHRQLLFLQSAHDRALLVAD